MNRTIMVFTYEKDENGIGTGKRVAVSFDIEWLKQKIAPQSYLDWLEEYTYDDVEYLQDQYLRGN